MKKFNTIVLKLSGEALHKVGSTDNISPEILENIAKQIKAIHDEGTHIAIVIGGGNFWRGASAAGRGMDRATADYVGMLATVMNALALESALEQEGIPCRVQTAIEMKAVSEVFIRRVAIKHLQRGNVVIFGGGTGNPFFTTDTTAALRANEIGADIIFKATNVDGIYDKDPRKSLDAKKYDNISYDEAVSKNLRVMDQTAFSLCRENKIPIVVFDINGSNNIQKALSGGVIGTRVS